VSKSEFACAIDLSSACRADAGLIERRSFVSIPPATRVLPAFPSLEQQKKQARELLIATRANDPSAVDRMRVHHPRWTKVAADGVSLHDAQLVLAREYGFVSWPKLKAHIESVVATHHTRLLAREARYYSERAQGLLAIIADGAAPVMAQVRQWHPDYANADDETIRTSDFTLADAQLVYAREHGFSDWARFIAYVGTLGRVPANEPFLAVVDAASRGDWKTATDILRADPAVARARGTNGNTLLNLACSMAPCDPVDDSNTTPQHPSQHRLDAVRLLLAAGADVRQANDRGWTPLHQAAYRNDTEMAGLLLAAGAPCDLSAHGDGGTPLAVALFWGHRDVAAVLAMSDVVPSNLRIAAALGRVELASRFVNADGDLSPDAYASRAFYRPHSGFPAWRPSDSAQEVLDEALVWAAKSAQIEAMDFLVRRGANVDADPYRGTPLIWASWNGHADAVTWLINAGADVNRRATFGGPSHGERVTALHLAAQSNRVAAVSALLALGADATAEDALYHGTAAGWAEHEGARDALAVLRAWTSRGQSS
jgi:ankyrin repeat protein